MGRAHAETLAREGASIVAFDICGPLKYSLAPAATSEDLRETAALVESHGQRCLTAEVDARDLSGLTDLADRTMSEFGRIDILVVNHGIWVVAPNSWELEEENWQESIDVLLTGAWKVCKAFVPRIIEGNRGGSVILTSSVNSVIPQPSAIAYTAAKHGLIGIMKVLAHELGSDWIRVNAVNPAGIPTPMVIDSPTVDKAMEYRPEYISNNRALLPEEWIPIQAVADAVLWLASDESKHVKGIQVPVDGGWAIY
jgi:NAD(P)-dependent dehydrogenase (short-subunit alcohol dehydrogenase family)